MSQVAAELAPLVQNRRQWLSIIGQAVEVVETPLVKREHGRYDMPLERFGQATLTYRQKGRDGERLVQRTLTVMQLSPLGAAVKSSFPLDRGLPVFLSVQIDERSYRLVGVVAHSTETLGGYKIGIDLTLAD